MIASGPAGCFDQLRSRKRTLHQEPQNLIPGVSPTRSLLSSLPPNFLLYPLVPQPSSRGTWGELGFQHSNSRKWPGYHIPFPISPVPSSNTTTQFSQGPGRGDRKQDTPPGGHSLSLTGVIAWTLSSSPRQRPHQNGEGADPGALSHQLDDTALQAAISNSRPPDRGQPHEMRNLSPYLGWGNSKSVSPKPAREGRGSQA